MQSGVQDVSDLFGVADKVVVVTGGSRGIGRMIATGFVEAGARVYISSRKADELQKTADEIGAVADPGRPVHRRRVPRRWPPP